MPQRSNIPRRHHYVPQGYLQNWTDSNGLMAVSINGEIRITRGATPFAVENDLYEFVDLSAADLRCIDQMARQIFLPCNPLVDAIVAPIFLNVLYYRVKKHEWDQDYAVVFDEFEFWPLSQRQKELYDSLREAAENDVQLTLSVIEAIATITAKGYEPLMTKIENDAWPVIREIVNERTVCLRDKRKLTALLHYLVNQCFRGPDYLRYIKVFPPPAVRELGVSPDIAKYVRYIMPFYIVNDLVRNCTLRKLLVIKNRTDLEFITTDKPNAIYGYDEMGNIPDIAYFPMSPRIGVLYGYRKAVNKFITKYGWEIKDRDLVDWFNREVISGSMRFVFASNAQTLADNGYHIVHYVG